MFDIEYKGANSIIISTKNTKIFIDPKLSLVGLKDLSTKDAVEMVTEERFSTDNPDTKLIIKGPGEYGVSEFDILGFAAKRHIDNDNEALESTVYRIEVDGKRIGVIGNIDDKLSDEQLEKLGVLDILIIPVGGNGYTLDATSAAGLVRLINPKIVIPTHYADNKLNYEVPQAELKLFISELGTPVETVSKYKSKNLAGTQPPLLVVELTRN